MTLNNSKDENIEIDFVVDMAHKVVARVVIDCTLSVQRARRTRGSIGADRRTTQHSFERKDDEIES